MKVLGCLSLVFVFLVGFLFNPAPWGCSAVREVVNDVAPLADPLLRAIGFCQSHPAVQDDALEAVRLAESGDRLGAALRVALAIEELRASGVQIPQSIDSDLVRTMAAIEGMQRGLRALSCRDPSTGKALAGCLHDAGPPKIPDEASAP